MEALSQNYGWTPNEIRDQKLEDLMAYIAILEGQGRDKGVGSIPRRALNKMGK